MGVSRCIPRPQGTCSLGTGARKRSSKRQSLQRVPERICDVPRQHSTYSSLVHSVGMFASEALLGSVQGLSMIHRCCGRPSSSLLPAQATANTKRDQVMRIENIDSSLCECSALQCTSVQSGCFVVAHLVHTQNASTLCADTAGCPASPPHPGQWERI